MTNRYLWAWNTVKHSGAIATVDHPALWREAVRGEKNGAVFLWGGPANGWSEDRHVHTEVLGAWRRHASPVQFAYVDDPGEAAVIELAQRMQLNPWTLVKEYRREKEDGHDA